MTETFINNHRRTYKFFYIARMPDGRCKIGVSHNPETRCADMGARLIAQVPCIRPYDIESDVKEILFDRAPDCIGALGTEIFSLTDLEVWLVWHYAHNQSEAQIRSASLIERSWPDGYGDPVEIQPKRPNRRVTLNMIQKHGIEAYNKARARRNA